MATSVGITADGRPMVPCGHPGGSVTTDKGPHRTLYCNLIRGHGGPHSHRDAKTFAVVDEWPKQ